MERQTLPVARWSALGVTALLVALGTGWWTLRLSQPLLGFAAALFLLIGFALLTPLATLVADHLMTPVVRVLFRVEGLLAARYLVESLARTSVVIAALMVAVAMWIGLTLMVGSFRDTVETWVSQTVRADLYVEPAGRTTRGSSATLPAEVVAAAQGLAEVAAVDTYRGTSIQYGGRSVGLVGLDFAVLARHGRILFREGGSAEILARARAEQGVIVTESFARRFGTRVGERIRLETPTGAREAPVFGVFYDYSTDAGAIVMDRRLYARWWRDPTINSIAFYLQPGVEPDAARRAFLAALDGRHALMMTTNQSLRRQVLHVFDQTFRITYALQAIVIVVAVLGILNTLTALILQRGREIAVLRAVGAWRGQIHRLVLIEAGLIGAAAHVIGSVCGVALALMLVHVINRQFFGWTIRFRLEPDVFLHSAVVILAAALVAALLPARHAVRRAPAEALRGE